MTPATTAIVAGLEAPRLLKWHVHLRTRRAIQTEVLDVADDAHDLARRRSIAGIAVGP